MNKAFIMGRVVRDIEVKETQRGGHFCRFSVAVKREFKKEIGNNVDFFSCIAFDNKAELIGKFFRKGKPIICEGRMEFNKFTDRNGVEKIGADLKVENFHFVESDTRRNDTPSEQTYQSASIQNYGDSDDHVEEAPF